MLEHYIYMHKVVVRYAVKVVRWHESKTSPFSNSINRIYKIPNSFHKQKVAYEIQLQFQRAWTQITDTNQDHTIHKLNIKLKSSEISIFFLSWVECMVKFQLWFRCNV